MGNQQQGDTSGDDIELDRSESMHLPNDIISGHVLYSKRRRAYISLTGIVYYEKHLEYCAIILYSIKVDLTSSSHTKQPFQIRFDGNLPPSFNTPTLFPRIFYSIQLVYHRAKDRIHSSLSVHICPRIQINQPLLLKPSFFGTVDNLTYGTKLEVNLTRSAFTFTEPIEIYYELRNASEAHIDTIYISLGVYYLVESSIFYRNRN